MEAQTPEMESGGADEGGGMTRWWTRVAKTNLYGLEGRDNALACGGAWVVHR